jgi:hypothetical protein
MIQSAKSDWAGSVTIPSDAAVGRPIRVRVLWYSPGTGGNVRLEARAKPGVQGGSNTVATAAELQAVVVAAPGTPNQRAQITFTFAATASPGQIVPVTLSRNGADETDTLTGSDVRVEQVELRYERAFLTQIGPVAGADLLHGCPRHKVGLRRLHAYRRSLGSE